MLYAYNNADQELAVGGAVLYPFIGIQTGCTATLAAGSGSVRLSRPGLFMVHFNADAAGVAAGDVTFQLFRNGVEVPGAEGTASSTAATDVVNIGFTAIVRVEPTCPCNTAGVTLVVQNTGVAATASNAAITVTKIA